MKNFLKKKKSDAGDAAEFPNQQSAAVKKKPFFTKKKVLIMAVILVLALCAGAAVWFFVKKSSGNQNQVNTGSISLNGTTISADGLIAASGVISIGTTEETFSVENLTAALEIEEVYVSSDDEIEEGTKILKLNEDDVSEAREELEETLRTAQLAYRSGAIEYEQSLITAVADRDSALLAGEQAQEVYDETISDLDSAVTQAKKELEEANESIAEYESYVNDGSYSTYFKVDEYQAIYDADLAILEEYMELYGITLSELSSGDGMSGGDGFSFADSESLSISYETTAVSEESTVSTSTASTTTASTLSETGASDETVTTEDSAKNGMNAGKISASGNDFGAEAGAESNTSDIGSGTESNTGDTSAADSDTDSADSEMLSTLKSFYKVVQTDLQNLEEAQEKYEDAVENAAYELQTLQLKLPSLEKAVAQAEENYETQILQAKLTYETSLSNAESAESDYETAVQKAESDYSTLRETYEDAKENLDLFEELVGDGYFYATGSGTVLSVSARTGGTLGSEGVILTYKNTDDTTVTVSVDQSYISSLSVGDTAVIVTSDYGNFEGSITQIDPVSSSSSRASVTYSVTVQLSSGSLAIPENESVTVIFGMTLEQVNEQMNSQGGADSSGNDVMDGEMPSGMQDGNMEMPSGEMPSGDMPSGGMPGGGEGGDMPSGMPDGAGGDFSGKAGSDDQQ